MAQEVSVALGPLASASARAWVTNAKRQLAVLRDDARPLPFEVPVEIADRFDAYLAEWEQAAAAGETFVWHGKADADDVRHLLTYWFNVATVINDRGPELGFPVAPPEAEPFYVDLVRAVTDALAAVDDEGLGQTLRDSWPGVGEHPASPAPPEPSSTGPVRVLIVDDTDDVRLLLRIALQTDDRFEVAGEAATGQEAVDHVRRGCPDAVVLDVMMPVMDGLTALPLILEQCPRSRVIVHSAHSSSAVESQAKGLGAAAVVAKGAPLDHLIGALLPTG